MVQSDSPSLEKQEKPVFSRSLFAAMFAAVLVIISLIAVAPALLDQDRLRIRLLADISNWVGSDLNIRGSFNLTLFPEFKVTLNDVASTQADAPIHIKARSIVFNMRTLPALLGRIEPSAIQFNDADISIQAQAVETLAETWQRNPLGKIAATVEKKIISGSSAFDLSDIANANLAKIVLSQSTLTTIELDGTKERISDINGSISWPGIRSSATLDAKANWRGETIELAGQVEDLLVFSAGGNSDLSLNIKSAPMNLAFEGKGNLVANLFAEGQLSWKTPSMRRFLRWVQASSTAGESFGAIELNANLITKEGKLFFNNLAMSVSGSLATGSLEVDPLVKPIKTSGTLAFKSVDLEALAASLPIGFGDEGAAELNLLDDLDLDLRLSAETAAISSYTITDAAGAIRISKGEASMDLGTGTIAGGTIMGRLELSGPSAQKTGHITVAISGLQQDQISGLPTGIPMLSGPLSGKFEVAGPYLDFKSLLATGTGTFKLKLESGVVRNFNLETMQSLIEHQNGFDLSTAYAGMSEAKEFSLKARVGNGVIAIETAKANIDGRLIVLSGTVPLLSKGIALSGIITDVDLTDATKPQPFFVGGTWRRPIVTTGAPN